MAGKKREDAVFIRKSTAQQDIKGQEANVEKMLKAIGVYVPKTRWFSGTSSRRKVRGNEAFARLMNLVEEGKVKTVYIESQDRWGTSDRPELFSLLGLLREHNTRLFDLREKKDLTEKDLATEMMAFIGSIKSEKELQDIAYRSLRTRVANFLGTGSWPTGTHPYGFGKECRSADGKLKWIFQPVNRSLGTVYRPSDKKLIPGQAKEKIPRKDRGDIIKLVPNENEDYVRAVKLIYDLYTNEGLSRRKISARLNEEGLQFNQKPFSHSAVTEILKNRVYMGDTIFGKNQSGELYTFDTEGNVIQVEGSPNGKRDSSFCIVMKNTHKPLIDRKTWKLAEKKLQDEQKRTSHAPRNPAYYLKQIFVCGHCGKSMAARAENKEAVYVCSEYLKGRQNGHPSSCGFHRIKHDDAEKMLLEKIEEMNLPFDTTMSQSAKENIEKRLARIGKEDDKLSQRYVKWISEGIKAVADYLKESYALDTKSLKRLRWLAQATFFDENRIPDKSKFKDLPVTMKEFKEALKEAETQAVKQAKAKLKEIKAEHKTMTLAWAKASPDMQEVMRERLDELEAQKAEWEPRTKPIRERLEDLYEEEKALQEERARILDEWPTMSLRERGEAFRRLFRTVTLHWDKEWHPAEPRPYRERKTKRPGRWSYTLRKDLTEYHFESLDSVASW